jgi:hypothetical protein
LDIAGGTTGCTSTGSKTFFRPGGERYIYKDEPDPVKEWVLARQISNYTMYQSGSVNTYVVAITAFIVPFRWQKSTVNQG